MKFKVNSLNKPAVVGVLLGIFSGLLNFVFLTFFNYMINRIILEEYTSISVTAIIIFGSIVISFLWVRRTTSKVFITFSQNLFWRLRIQILQSVLKADYETLQKERSEVNAALIHDVGILTQSSLNIIHFITSLVVLMACFAYMIYLSGPLFLLTIAACGIGVGVYLLGSRVNNNRFEKTRELERGFMKHFSSILDGFKEINMTPVKGQAIMKNKIRPIAEDSFQNNSSAFVSFLNNQITGQLMFYILIASILLVCSVTMGIDKVVVVNFLFILLYVLGALEGILVLIPSLSQAFVAYKRLNKLKENLQSIVQQKEVVMDSELSSVPIFTNLSGSEIEFSYTSESSSFGIGPISFEFDAQDIVFIYGGNGSGKTTFVHAILGLLKPKAGEIKFNGQMLDAGNYSEYRNLFSIVFNDFYLFEEFYGNRNFDRERAKAYLKMFEIDSKVAISETGFSTVDLSTGQRKRLALITALLEDRPIVVLDEWAADQDPHFRKKFYTEILPQLKQEGFTILAITHDDAYYQCCDKLLRMDFGKLTDETAKLRTESVV